jgi:hypothetical protein
MRARGQLEDITRALQEISVDISAKKLSSLSTQADYLLLSGYPFAALRTHLQAVLRTPWRRTPYLKALRWGLYMLAPAWRPRLFGHSPSVKNSAVTASL